MKIQQIDAWRWRIPREGPMRVDGVFFASESMLESLRDDPCLQQLANVATLPGILRYSLAMPDIHWGYGFPIGGVAAFGKEDGVISPGGVGFDINCGVRLLRTDLRVEALQPELPRLADVLQRSVPSGVGSRRKDFRLDEDELRAAVVRGAAWAVEQGYGEERDLLHIEEQGAIPGADPDRVSAKAFQRGMGQMGTLGSGNHFLEVDRIDEIYDERIAAALGLEAGKVAIIIHTGSRGFGHQICTDFVKVMQKAAARYGIELPDRQLACAPLRSPEARDYLAAMACGANYAFNNRQIITHYVRQSFAQVFGPLGEPARCDVVYDVCHNIAKMETHLVDGGVEEVCVHRKGATRAFPPNHPETPKAYREVGQPVLIPGDMGRYSFVLVGTERAYEWTFGSTCHGAGRRLSRGESKRTARGRNIAREMAAMGVELRAASRATVVEEIPEAYKDVADVVDVVEGAGISRQVARLRPLAVIKG